MDRFRWVLVIDGHEELEQYTSVPHPDYAWDNVKVALQPIHSDNRTYRRIEVHVTRADGEPSSTG
jgi:hypothetical protein